MSRSPEDHLTHGNSRRAFFFPVFDSRKLLADYSGWGPHVKPDLEQLEQIAGEFSVVTVIDQLWASCQRAYAKTLAYRKAELMAAAELIRRVAEEAAPDGESPVLVQVDPNADRLDDLRYMTIQAIRVDLADLAETALQQAAAIVDVGPDHLN